MGSFEHEDVRMLPEIVSEGNPGTGFIPGPRVNRRNGAPSVAPTSGVSAERVAELRKANTTELQVLMHRRAPALSVEELQVLHQIAAERAPLTSSELALMRDVIQELVVRLKK
jgi:hypothetical protein